MISTPGWRIQPDCLSVPFFSLLPVSSWGVPGSLLACSMSTGAGSYRNQSAAWSVGCVSERYNVAMLLILYGSLAHNCWKERSKGGSMLLFLSLLLILPPPTRRQIFNCYRNGQIDSQACSRHRVAGKLLPIYHVVFSWNTSTATIPLVEHLQMYLRLPSGPFFFPFLSKLTTLFSENVLQNVPDIAYSILQAYATVLLNCGIQVECSAV